MQTLHVLGFLAAAIAGASAELLPGDTTGTSSHAGVTVRCAQWTGETCDLPEFFIDNDFWRLYSSELCSGDAPFCTSGVMSNRQSNVHV